MMKSIDCTDTKAMLSPYIDGELDVETLHLIERHLSGCDDCRELVNQAERFDALIARDVELTTPAGLSPDFFGAVMSRTVYAEPPRTGRIGRLATMAGWMAAAAAFALAGGIWINQQVRPTVPETVAIEQGDPYSSTSQRDRERSTPVVESPRRYHDDFYAAGLDLRSEAFDGVLPAEVFQVTSRASAMREYVADSEQELTSKHKEVRVADAPRQTRPPSREIPMVDETSLVALMTPHTVLVSSSQVESSAMLASMNGKQQEVDINRPTIEREHADTIYAASILMDLLLGADPNTFADVEHVRRVVEVDNILPRLTEARDRLQPADRPAVFAAESVLTRIAQGPLDSEDLHQLRDTVATLNLSDELGSITERWDRASSM